MEALVILLTLSKKQRGTLSANKHGVGYTLEGLFPQEIQNQRRRLQQNILLYKEDYELVYIPTFYSSGLLH